MQVSAGRPAYRQAGNEKFGFKHSYYKNCYRNCEELHFGRKPYIDAN